jgi:hypothetical protein
MKTLIFYCLFLFLGTSLYAQTEQEANYKRAAATQSYNNAEEALNSLNEKITIANAIQNELTQLISDLQSAVENHPNYSNPQFQSELADNLSEADTKYISFQIAKNFALTKMNEGIDAINAANQAACSYDWFNAYNYANEACLLLDPLFQDGARNKFQESEGYLDEFISIFNNLYCIVSDELYNVNNL